MKTEALLFMSTTKAIRTFSLAALFLLLIIDGKAQNDIYVNGVCIDGEIQQTETSLHTPQTCVAEEVFVTEQLSPSGLASDGTNVWIVGSSSVFMASADPLLLIQDYGGNIIDTVNVDGSSINFGGLYLNQDTLWAVHEQAATLYKLNKYSGEVYDSFPLPTFGSGDPNNWGITSDGTYLWNSEYEIFSSSTLFKIDPLDGSVLDTLFTDLESLLAIEFINGQMYGVSRLASNLYTIDLLTGETTYVDEWCLPGSYGISYECATESLYGISGSMEIGGVQTLNELTDFDFLSCCDEFEATTLVECSTDSTTFYVTIMIEDEDLQNEPGDVDNFQYDILASHTGGFSGTFEENVFTDGPFPSNSAYEYSIELIGNPDCLVVLNDSIYCSGDNAIELLDFSGFKNEDCNELRWTTGTEQDHSHIELERSQNLDRFELLRSFPGVGDIDYSREYDFQDCSFPVGVSYYRLSSVDTDGKIEYSNILSIDRSPKIDGVSISPNPTPDILSITMPAKSELPVLVQVYSSSAVLLLKRSVSQESIDPINISLRDFPDGIYFVEIRQDDFKGVHKILKK